MPPDERSDDAPQSNLERLISHLRKGGLGVGEQAADMIAPPHVSVLRFLEEAREQRQRQRMAAEILRGRPQVAVHAPDVIVTQELRARFVREPFDIDDRRRASLESLDVGNREAARQGAAAAKRRNSARRLWSLSWPACGPGPCCNGSVPSSRSAIPPAIASGFRPASSLS